MVWARMKGGRRDHELHGTRNHDEQRANDSPANVEAANMFKENIKEYERRVKVCYPLFQPVRSPPSLSWDRRVLRGTLISLVHAGSR